VRVAAAGKQSVSVFKPVQFFGQLATLMEVDIPTGRTHQIRVHASFAGHPLLGDDKYGDRERNAELRRHGLKRTFLHAQSVAFEWPDSGVPFHVSAPLPADLAAVLDSMTPVKRKIRAPQHGDRSQVRHGPSGTAQQLLDARCGAGRLAHDRGACGPIQHGHLVGADNPAIPALAHATGLRPGEARYQHVRRLTGMGRLIDARRLTGENEAQPFQQLSPISRRRRQNEGGLGLQKQRLAPDSF
jgi:hypothetical protein